jgi:hypothetical protein
VEPLHKHGNGQHRHGKSNHAATRHHDQQQSSKKKLCHGVRELHGWKTAASERSMAARP